MWEALNEKSVWMQVIDGKYGTYGTISSFKPLRNRMGTSVILGSMSSLVHCWWHSRTTYLATGNTLEPG